MREVEFYNWMLQSGIAPLAASSRKSSCLRVEEAEHINLDVEYERDACESLLDLYVYTTQDEREGNPVLHHAEINGNLRTGTASMRSAIAKYVDFRTQLENGVINNTLAQQPTGRRNRRTRVANANTIQNTTPNRESYGEFFDFYGIDAESLCEFGIDRSVFASPEQAIAQWNDIKDCLQNNRKLAIRMRDKNSVEFLFYKKLYEHIFNYNALTADENGNYFPKRNLENAMNIKVTINPPEDVGYLVNFQTSHGFSGRTKNPLMYSSIWNVVFTPKVIDPFTGDEATGPYAEAFRSAFQYKIKTLFRQCVQEFNEIVDAYEVERKIMDFQCDEIDQATLNRLRGNALSQWQKIPLDET